MNEALENYLLDHLNQRIPLKLIALRLRINKDRLLDNVHHERVYIRKITNDQALDTNLIFFAKDIKARRVNFQLHIDIYGYAIDNPKPNYDPYPGMTTKDMDDFLINQYNEDLGYVSKIQIKETNQSLMDMKRSQRETKERQMGATNDQIFR